MKKLLLALWVGALLVGCGGDSSSDRKVERLEKKLKKLEAKENGQDEDPNDKNGSTVAPVSATPPIDDKTKAEEKELVSKDDPSVPDGIDCSSCGLKVSKLTDECRQCGHPVALSIEAFKEKAQKAYEEKIRRQALTGKLVEGQTYYLFASQIELYPTNLDNDPWDGGENGPDIRYSLLWRGNKIFGSDIKNDALIADWSGLTLDLEWRDLLGKTLGPTNPLIKAARVRYEKGGVVEIVVMEDDLTDDDDAGRSEIEFDDLVVGKNEIKLRKTSINAVRRINIRALPINATARDLVYLMERETVSPIVAPTEAEGVSTD